MKYRPDEATLISWMYGDLDEADRIKVDEWLAENPAELEKLRAMQSARDVMSRAVDKEVLAPPLIMGDSARVVSIWRSTWFRAAASIAASFLLILVAGRLMGPDIRMSNGELRISFGKTQPAEVQTPQQAILTANDVREMIDASVKTTEARLDERLTTTQAQLNESVRKALQSPGQSQLDTIVSRMSRASEQQIRAFVSGLRDENMLMFRQYVELSASEQRTYMENLLVDFSKWQQEQRNQDLLLFQARVNTVEQNTNQLKEETEQILSSLISNAGIIEKNSN